MNDKRPVGRPPGPTGKAADSTIVLRVPKSKKAVWVKTSQANGETLSAWIQRLADAECREK